LANTKDGTDSRLPNIMLMYLMTNKWMLCVYFLSTWGTYPDAGFTFCVSSLLPHFSDFISIGILPRASAQYAPAIALELS